MKISIQKFITPGIPFAMLLIVACVFLWVINFIFRDYFQIFPAHNTAFGEIENILNRSKLTLEIAGLVILFFNTFLLLQLNTKYSLIRSRSLLHCFLFLMSAVVWSVFDISVTDHLSVTFVLFSLMIFMDMYRDTSAVRKAFTGSMFIGIAGFFAPPLILILPAVWVSLILFQSMSVRIFLASLFGIVAPWIIYVTINMNFHSDLLWAEKLIGNFTPALPQNNFPLHILIFGAITLLVFLIGLTEFFNGLRHDSIQTRQRLKLFIWLFFISVTGAVFYSDSMPVFLAVSAISFSMILAHPLTLQKSLFNSVLLIILCIANIAFVIINFMYYTDLWN